MDEDVRAAADETGPAPDSEVVRLRDAVAAGSAELARLEGERHEAVERLRSALLASEPALAPELVRGETAAEVEASFTAARAALARVREELRREHGPDVGAGAPGRAAQAPVSAFDKIRQGISALGQR